MDTNLGAFIQAALDNGTLLRFCAGVYQVNSTIDLHLSSMMGPLGFSGGGIKLISNIHDGSPIMKINMTGPAGSDVRYLTLEGFTILGNGAEGDGLVIECDSNASWVHTFVLRDVNVEGCGGNGMVLQGSVFEGQLFNCSAMSNKLDGMLIQPFAGGVASAIKMFGGGLRKNVGRGIYLANGMRDLKAYGVDFIENGGFGLAAAQGLSLASGCHFENNGVAGIAFQNFANIIACTGGTYGPQTSLVSGFLNGPLTMIACSMEYYGSEPDLTKLANVNGTGKFRMFGEGAVTVALTVTYLPY